MLFRTGAKGDAAHVPRDATPIFFPEKENGRRPSKRKAFPIASEQLEELQCLPIAPLACGKAAFTPAIRLGVLLSSAAALPISRWYSLISVYRSTHQCGERSNAAFRKQSAAKQTSLAPHDSKARLQAVTTRRDSWRSHVHRTLTAQRVQPFKLQTANVRGQGAAPLAFSWGSKGAILSRERMAPFTRFFARRKGLTPPRSGSYQQSYLTNS